VFKTVDTCAAEFQAQTPYHYSSYEEEDEVNPSDGRKVIILGSGPNRIGQGIEFDYSCVHAAMTLRDAGIETVMVNCNPETVSTDYDMSDRLYFEPLTLEDVLEIVHAESRVGELLGVVVQLGGQTPLGLAGPLALAGVPISGTSPSAIHLAEDRGSFSRVLASRNLRAPEHGTAMTVQEARDIAARIGFPVLVRPSYVLGGRGMEIVHDVQTLDQYITRATQIAPEHPVLVDAFLAGAIEIDVDALFDGSELFLAGVMEHVEEAGIHSGDSACALPPMSLDSADVEAIRDATLAIAEGVGVRGLLNVQYALAEGVLYVLEANPRASRTVPFVSKATGVQLAKAATRIMAGWTIAQLRAEGMLPAGEPGVHPSGSMVAVKEAVLPFARFLGTDPTLGPEMRSTGEVMGLGATFGEAFAKAQEGAYRGGLPTTGRVVAVLGGRDAAVAARALGGLQQAGLTIVAPADSAAYLTSVGVPVDVVTAPGREGMAAVVDEIWSGRIDLVVSTPDWPGTPDDGVPVRAAAVARGVPCITTARGVVAAVDGIRALQGGRPGVLALQTYATTLR
jgi:carbamoyl-phosphate synthase large subunit